MNLLEKISEHFSTEMKEVENLIKELLNHDIDVINQILHHIVSSGGKRFRPLLLIASHALLNGVNLSAAVRMGTSVELIHTATLLHDDVIDQNDLRRGQTTANHIFGNAYSILVGDYLFTKSFDLLIKNNDMEVLAIVSEAFMLIAEGEIVQMMNVANFDIELETSLIIIKAKTAKLISASCKIGSMIAGGTPEQIKSMEEYGEHLGVLFQIADDILDYFGDMKSLGKPTGSDFLEGKVTLPLLYAFKSASKEECKTIQTYLKSSDIQYFDIVKQFIEKYQGKEKAIKFAENIKEQALKCLEGFKEGEILEFFKELTHYSLTRLK